MIVGARILLFMLLVCLPFLGISQTTLIKINPLSLPLATVNGSVEQYVGGHISLQLSAYYTQFRFKQSNYSGWAVTPEVRYYFNKEVALPTGWYIAPFARYSQMYLDREATDDTHHIAGKAHFLGGGAVAGHQWLLGEHKRVAINIFAGPTYCRSIGVDGSASAKDYKADFITGGSLWVRSGVTVGIAF